MNQESAKIFAKVYQEAYQKCFHHELKAPLSEADSKVFCHEIEEKTGLVIGYKSVKNYSIFILGEKEAKPENPSPATLDTFARYVLNAPATTESARKKNESHYPYWHQYKQEHRTGKKTYIPKGIVLGGLAVAVLLIVFFTALSYLMPSENVVFYDDFDEVEEASLRANAWIPVNKDSAYWQKRNDQPGHLSLYTLEGDNWPDPTSAVQIKNLLIRPVEAACFDADAHLSDFFPQQRWQQAGIILLEDSLFEGNVVRLSLAYNDFFGGYDLPAEVLIQGITSDGADNPEEFLHHRLFQIEDTTRAIVKSNLRFCGLRIEKRADNFRFLLASGSTQNAAYHEIGTHRFSIKPKYIGIFAIKGYVEESEIIAATFDAFSLQTFPCEE